MSAQLGFSFATEAVSPWFAGRVPCSRWHSMGGDIGAMPGAPFIFWYDEAANPFPKRITGKRRGTTWRRFAKEPSFWAMPVYDYIRRQDRPVQSDEVTMQLVRSEPISEASLPLLKALWSLVMHDWLCFRFCTNDSGTDIEFCVFADSIADVKLLPEVEATAESNALFRCRLLRRWQR